MIRFKHSDSGDRGWFVGSFDKAVYKTNQFEVAYMFDPAGSVSARHVHKLVTEINLITSGCAVVNGQVFHTGEGFIINPGDECEAMYMEDTYTICVKTPSVPSDKYYV